MHLNMRKSNSKQLYRVARRLKAKDTAPEDSLELENTHKPAHYRSQSCPFDQPHPSEPCLRERSSNCPPMHHKKPSQASSSSQGSTGSQTVIIREPGGRAQERKGKELVKRSLAGLKSGTLAWVKVGQQMRSYDLRAQLATLQKETQSTSIKQRIMEGLLMRCEHELEHSFEFA